MVRAFAAISGVLRANPETGERRSASTLNPSPTHFMLDRIVVGLVILVLTISAYSVIVYFSVAREEQLQRGDLALALSSALVANEVSRAAREGTVEGMELPILPAEVALSGRRFILLDKEGIVRGGHTLPGEIGHSARDIFANANTLTRVKAIGFMHRVVLKSGEEASAILRMPRGFDGQLLSLQQVRHILLPWRQHISRMGALLASFAAITIAFTLVFVAQRRRTCSVGASAEHISRVAELAMQNGRCGLWEWQMDRDTVFWSDSMHRMLGRAPDGFKSCGRIMDRLHPDNLGLMAELRGAVARGEMEISSLFRIRHEDGSWLWLRMRALPVEGSRRAPRRLLGIVMDVTQEQNAELESRRADIRLREGIDSLSEAFVLWDEHNCLVMCNSRYQSFHALPDELVKRGIPYETIMAAAHQPKVLIENDHSTTRKGERSYEAQFQDGRWLLISERRTAEGGYASVGTDITARKLQEDRLLENERHLRLTITDLRKSREAFRRQASQIAELADKYLEQKAQAVSANRAKAEFLANMHHEIRTPLNHIIGFAEMIEAEVFGPCGASKYVDYARDIRTSGTTLMGMFSEILDMAHIEAGRVALERCDVGVGGLLEDAAATVQDSAESKKITLTIDPTSRENLGQRTIFVDPKAITQALSHLLSNSIRLTSVEGEISIRARFTNDHVNIFVADSAERLSDCELGTMADPFGHIDRMLEDGCKGAGLGLSIARALVELHGGTLKMRATPHFGTLMMVRLPTSFSPVQLDLPMSR